MSYVTPVERNTVEKHLLVELARQQIIINRGFQPSTYQWDTIASRFNASKKCSSKANKTELLKLWRTLKAAAEHARQNFGAKVLNDPLLSPIDRLLREYSPGHPKSAMKSKKAVPPIQPRSATKSKKAVPPIPPDMLRRSKRKLFSLGQEEKTDDVDVELARVSDKVVDAQSECFDHLSAKRPKTGSKRSHINDKGSVVIKKKIASVDEKQRTKRQNSVRNAAYASKRSDNVGKSCPDIRPESSKVDVCTIPIPRVSQEDAGATSGMSPHPRTQYPTFVTEASGPETPTYLMVDNKNTGASGNGVNWKLSEGVPIAADTGSDSNHVANNAGMVRSNVGYFTMVSNDLMNVANNFVTAENNPGLVANFSMVANKNGRVTNIAREGSFFLPFRRDNARIMTVSAGMVSNNPGMVANNPGMVANNSSMVANNSRLVASYPGMVANNSWMVANNPEMVANNPEMVANNPGMVANNSWMVANNPGMVANNPGMVEDNSRMVANNSRMVANNSRMVANNSRMVANNSRMVANNVGMVTNNAGMVANISRMIENNPGMAANNSRIVANNAGGAANNAGMAANNAGMAANNAGMAANNAGMAANNSGMAANNSGMAANNAGMAANNVGMVANNAGMAANNVGMAVNNVGMTANNAGMTANNAGMTANNAGMTANKAGTAANNAGVVENNAGMVANNSRMVADNAGIMNGSEVAARSLVRISRLATPVIPRSPNSPASGENSQLMSAPSSSSTPKKTYLIPSSLLKDSTNFQSRNEDMPQSEETRLQEEFQVLRLRQTKELHEAKKKLLEAQMKMDQNIAEQSRKLHNAKIENEALIAEQNRKFGEDKLKQSALNQKFHDAKMRSEDEIGKQRRALHTANLRAIEISVTLSQELHKVEMEAARLKRDVAETHKKIAMLKLKKIEMELEHLNAMSEISQ